LVLARLAAEFDWERTYTEPQVNAVLRKFNADVATLRRELVMTKRLIRTRNGIYKKAGPKDVLLRRA
jgi:hypothetical protein